MNKKSPLLLVFVLSFISFILGWLCAVSVTIRPWLNENPSKITAELERDPQTGTKFEDKPAQLIEHTYPSSTSKENNLSLKNATKTKNTHPKEIANKNKKPDKTSLMGKTINSAGTYKSLVSSEPLYIRPASGDTGLNNKKSKTSSLTAKKTKNQSDSDSSSHNSKLLENIKKNILILFDPYKIDKFSLENTHLQTSNSYISKNQKKIQLKKSAAELNTTNLKSNKLNLRFFSDKKNSQKYQTGIKNNTTNNHLKDDRFKNNKLKKELLDDELSIDINKKPRMSEALKKIQTKNDKINKEQLLAIEKQQKFFKSDANFSFLVNVFSTQDKALEYVNQMKSKYPMWSFLLKAHTDHVRIYLGPFPSKELATQFKKSLTKPIPFSSLEYLETISL